LIVTGSAELTDHADEALQLAAAENLHSPPNADRTPDVQPVGHADPTPLLLPDGSDGNEELLRLRAVAVRDALIALDSPPHRIAEPEGMGATKLIDEGTDPESLGRNRRVELIVACESSP
jgi:flagellar motor protein MotB